MDREQFIRDIVFREISASDDAALAAIVRKSLKGYGLDIPGTAYYDSSLDRLSAYYQADREKRVYIVLTDGSGTVCGGAGLAECSLFPDCCEMQKLYIDGQMQGRGLGYELIRRTEKKAAELGYRRIYLETHSVLETAVHVYEKCGFRRIHKPENAVHSAMDLFYLKDIPD